MGVHRRTESVSLIREEIIFCAVRHPYDRRAYGIVRCSLIYSLICFLIYKGLHLMFVPNEVGDRPALQGRCPLQVVLGYPLRVPRSTIASSLPYAHRYSAGRASSTSTAGGADVWETRWSWSCGIQGIGIGGVLLFRTKALRFCPQGEEF